MVAKWLGGKRTLLAAGVGYKARCNSQVTCASGDHTFRYQSRKTASIRFKKKTKTQQPGVFIRVTLRVQTQVLLLLGQVYAGVWRIETVGVNNCYQRL